MSQRWSAKVARKPTSTRSSSGSPGSTTHQLSRHLSDGTTFEEFFADARLNPNASLITGVVCGVRVQEVEDPLMQKIRYLDLLVDELARGKSMEKILRVAQTA